MIIDLETVTTGENCLNNFFAYLANYDTMEICYGFIGANTFCFNGLLKTNRGIKAY